MVYTVCIFRGFSLTGNCDGGHICNCNMNDYTWRADEGYLTDKSDLPVTEMTAGDTSDGDEQAYMQLWPMYCKGDESCEKIWQIIISILLYLNCF